jgi:hypothetical protein
MRCWIADKGGAHGSLNFPDALKGLVQLVLLPVGQRSARSRISSIGDALNLGKKDRVPSFR